MIESYVTRCKKQMRVSYALFFLSSMAWPGCIDLGHESAWHDGVYSAVSCQEGGSCERAAIFAADECTPGEKLEVEIEFATPVIHFLVDQSNSMNDSFGGGISRWQAVQDVLLGVDGGDSGIIADIQGRAEIGATLYSAPNDPNSACPEIESRSPRRNSLSGIQTLFAGETPLANTPTAESLEKMADEDFPSKDETGIAPRIVVVVTDGAPDTCTVRNPTPETPQSTLNEQNVDKAEDVRTQYGFDFYMLRVGSASDVSDEHMQEMANVGVGLDRAEARDGVKAPYYSANSIDVLKTEFASILGSTYRCTFILQDAIANPEDSTVSLGANTLTYQTDWILSGDDVLELMGQACEQYREDAASALSVEVDCGAADVDAGMPGGPGADAGPMDPGADAGSSGSDAGPGDPGIGDGDNELVYGGGGCNAGGGDRGGFSSILLIWLSLLIWLMISLGVKALRRYRRARGICVALAGLLGGMMLLAMSTSAHAQRYDGFAAERLQLTMDREGLIDVEWADVYNRSGWDLSVWGAVSHDVVILYNQDDERDRLGSSLGMHYAGNIVGSLAVSDSFQLGIDVPLILAQDAGDDVDPLMSVDYPGAGFGDVRLMGKWQLLSAEKRGVHLALVPALSLPTGDNEAYRGDVGPIFTPAVAVSRAFGAVRLSGNLGYKTRASQRESDPILDVRDEFFLRLGAGYRFADSVGVPLSLSTSLSMATGAANPIENFHENQSELLGGISYDIMDFVQVAVAGGVGLTQGVGTPEWRALVGVRLGRRILDRDRDGIPDKDDACPLLAENRNGFEDRDGCPEEGPTTPVVAQPPCEDCAEKIAAALAAQEPQPVAECPAAPEPKVVVKEVVKEVCAQPPEPEPEPEPEPACTTVAELTKIPTIEFANASDVVRPGSRQEIRRIAEAIQGCPTIKSVAIHGHTDNRGKVAYNVNLSQRRAAAVVRLLGQFGVAKSLLKEAQGHGPRQPIASNDTAEGRAKNRRVEFNIERDE